MKTSVVTEKINNTTRSHSFKYAVVDRYISNYVYLQNLAVVSSAVRVKNVWFETVGRSVYVRLIVEQNRDIRRDLCVAQTAVRTVRFADSGNEHVGGSPVPWPLRITDNVKVSTGILTKNLSFKCHLLHYSVIT